MDPAKIRHIARLFEKQPEEIGETGRPRTNRERCDKRPRALKRQRRSTHFPGLRRWSVSEKTTHETQSGGIAGEFVFGLGKIQAEIFERGRFQWKCSGGQLS